MAAGFKISLCSPRRAEHISRAMNQLESANVLRKLRMEGGLSSHECFCLNCLNLPQLPIGARETPLG